MAIQFSLANLINEAAPLYHIYPQQFQPQYAYVELSEDGTVSADYSGEIGNAVPARVWHNCDLRYSVPAAADGDALAALLQGAAAPLLERIHAGHSVDWDGSNFSGTLDADADAAAESLESLLRDVDCTEIYDVDQWVENETPEKLVAAGSVAALAQECEDAISGGQFVYGDCAAAIAKRCAELAGAYIRCEHAGNDTIKRAIDLLIEFDAGEYGYLRADYADEFSDAE